MNIGSTLRSGFTAVGVAVAAVSVAPKADATVIGYKWTETDAWAPGVNATQQAGYTNPGTVDPTSGPVSLSDANDFGITFTQAAANVVVVNVTENGVFPGLGSVFQQLDLTFADPFTYTETTPAGVTAATTGVTDLATSHILSAFNIGGAASELTLTVTLNPEVVTTPVPTPEPASMALLGVGLLGLAGVRRHYRNG